MTTKRKRQAKSVRAGGAETVADLRREFVATVSKLWPVAGGSLSLRKNSCVREGCAACASGAGHPAYGLWGRGEQGRFGIYVPQELAPELEEALAHGRALQELVMELGVRYVQARKAELSGPAEQSESQPRRKPR